MTDAQSLQNVKLDKAAMEILEEPLVKTPYELMRKNHRAAQRLVEKEFNQLQSLLKNLLGQVSSGSASADDILSQLRDGATRSSGLKRKLEAMQPASANTAAFKSRLGLLSDLEDMEDTVNPSQASWQQWHRNRLNRFSIEYLLRNGKTKTAESLAADRDIADQADFALFAERTRIETALESGHSCSEALAWCGENRGTLKKTNNYLEFGLRLQEYIELCRKRDSSAALAYVRKNLAPWKETHFNEIQQAIALLAFNEHCNLPAYDRLYDNGRWANLRKEFRETFNSLYALPSQSLLSLSVSAGLSSLKLAACCPDLAHHTAGPSDQPYDHSRIGAGSPIPSLPAAPPIHVLGSLQLDPSLSEGVDPQPLHVDPSHPHRNLDCPSCHDSMAELVKQVPYSHHVNSTIVCRMSGKVMDDENYPMAFPNGYVYSHKALLEMAKDSYDMMVTCPRTGEQVPYSRLRKVYIS